MPILAFLFSSAGKYVLGGLGILAVLGGLYYYISTIKADRDAALNRAKAAEADVTVFKASNDELTNANSQLRLQLQVNDQASQQVQEDSRQLTLNLGEAKKEVDHAAPTPVNCQALTPRDAAALAGLRNLISQPAPSSGSAGAGGESPAAGKPPAGDGSSGADQHQKP